MPSFVKYSILCVSLVLSFCQVCLGQRVSVQTSRAPYYSGEPVVVQITVNDLQEGQQVDCAYKGADTANVLVTGPSVSRRSQSAFINGRVSSSSSTDFTFRCTSLGSGTVAIGPFEVTVDGERIEVEAVEFDFKKLPEDPGMQLKLTIPRERVYVGERVPVEIEWAFSGNRNEMVFAYNQLVVRSAMFDQFEFLDVANSRRDQNAMRVETARGDFDLVAEESYEERDGQQFLVLKATRYLVAKTPGTFDGLQASCRTVRAKRFVRDFLSTRPVDPQPALANSQPISLEVLTLPIQGRPTSFSGAVGESFTIETAANRSVVRVGDPISLDVTLRGSGNLQDASLPLVAGSQLLNEELFSLPEESPPGNFSKDSKQFKVPIRVNDPGVDEIPPIAFSWFNPIQEEYQTTYSEPIALSVREAQIISSSDVVGGFSNDSGQERTESQAVSPSSVDFVGANLAIEKNTATLLASTGLLSLESMEWPIYGVAVALLLAGVILPYLSRYLPEPSERLATQRSLRQQIRQLEKRPARDGARELARLLRESTSHGRENSSMDNIIEACDALVYSPNEVDASRVTELTSRALRELESQEGVQ